MTLKLKLHSTHATQSSNLPPHPSLSCSPFLPLSLTNTCLYLEDALKVFSRICISKQLRQQNAQKKERKKGRNRQPGLHSMRGGGKLRAKGWQGCCAAKKKYYMTLSVRQKAALRLEAQKEKMPRLRLRRPIDALCVVAALPTVEWGNIVRRVMSRSK